MEDLKRIFRLSGWMMLVAVAMLAAYDGGGGSNALSGTTSPLGSQKAKATPAAQCTAGNLFTLENNNKYPIWLGEFVGDPTEIIVPPLGWKMEPGGTVNLCTTPPWASGRFWARTECDFEDLYQSGPATGTTRMNPFTSCTKDTDCPTNLPDGGKYDCLGGVCMVDCTSNQTNAFCQGEMGNPGNTDAICSTNTPTTGPKFDVCTYGGGVVCKTGDCAGLYQCEGSWTNGGVENPWIVGGVAPASLFEPTSTSATVVNYDVSNVSGYNTEIRVEVSPQPMADLGFPNNCYEPKCVSDLNESCPLNLEVTEAPTTTGPVKCGNGTGLYCQSGACENCQTGSGQACDANNKKTCVIGCNDPGDQCASPPANAQNLDCDTTIPSPSGSPSPSWTPDGSTYYDMYQAANKSGNVDMGHLGTAMSSQNQGNPTCWTDPGFAGANIDCAPDQVCDTKDFSTLGFPAGVGACVYKMRDAPTGDTGGLAPQIHCGAAADPGGAGDACGGYYTAATPPLYPDALGYTCNNVTINVGGYKSKSTLACLPAFGPDSVVGLGTYETPLAVTPPQAPLYTGTGSEMNPEWLAAAQWATGNGTTPGRPFYEYFSKACPHAYAWTYDDNAGGLSCNSSATGGKNQNVNFTIEFGPKSEPPAPSVTPTPTATASSTATATATSTAATATATATPTATATATITATPTATSTGATSTATPTATATTTATSTSTTTPTSTMTPSPSSTATPSCTPDIYLTTNPTSTLAFGDVQVGSSVTLPLMVTNNEPAGALNLTAKIRHRDVEDFAVTGGTCTTDKKLNAGETCTYKLRFKGNKHDQGAGVSTDFVVTGRFGPAVCPMGDIQSTSVTLAGAVDASGTRTHDSR